MNNKANRILDILACPICKGKMHYDQHQQELVCKFDKLAYQIHENIPIMLVTEARRLDSKN